MIAKYFPSGHPRQGQETNFRDKILAGLCMAVVDYTIEGHPIIQARENTERLTGFSFHSTGGGIYDERIVPPFVPKIHTIRHNYNLWKKRIDVINADKAVLSLRQWEGTPYKSKQIEFLSLGEGIGIQKASVENKIFTSLGKEFTYPYISIEKQTPIDFGLFMGNDGFEGVVDFAAWFKKPVIDGALIHFTTNFRYD